MTSQELYMKAYQQHYKHSNYSNSFTLYLQVIRDFPSTPECRYAEQQLENIIRLIDANSIPLDDSLSSVWCDYRAKIDARSHAEAERVKEQQRQMQAVHDRKSFVENERERVRNLVRAESENNIPIYNLDGCRGRSMKVYKDRCVITTAVTIGSIATANATDGQKTIFYSDIVGVQYKPCGSTIGYIQLETSAAQMNNLSNNFFSENTFTFNSVNGMEEVRDYIIFQVSLHKQT